MSDCHPAPFGSNLLLAPASQISSDQLSTFSATNTDQSSPPYSGHDAQYSTPESHYNDRESPSSDQLNIDANPSDFSPEAETSSDRDESPDTDSTSSGAHDIVDIKTESDTVDLQREILRLQSFANNEETKPPSHLNLLAAFNNQLLNAKFASNFLTDQLAPKPATPAVAQLTSTLPQPTPESATPTKRKRQRRNPVWPYFDVIDGTAKCKQCLYTTKSVFSTNLKVHLRSHHRSDYEKVIAAEDALNLNALLMSGNASKFLNPDVTRKRIPPMTSSILMTINKLANQQNEDNPLHSVLRQTLAAGTMQQLQQQMAQQQHKPAQIPLNAANLAALNNLARLNQNGTAQVPSLPTMAGADSLFSQFNFANVKQEVGTSPHGTDPNGMPQPKRRRLRRHPVWMFFRDLEDRMVGCINCNFRTGSAFSTNLKMHLKAHHKEDYERVLKLEDDMRMEEGIPNNKIKSELIDYIRGGGNASTPPSINSAIPKPSPLVQQFISQTMAGRTGPPTPKKDNVDDDLFNGMSMSDKLAALVGLTPAAGRVEGEVQDEKPLQLNPLEEFKRTFLAANMGLQPPPQEQTLISLNGTILHSDAKSTSSVSTDVSGEDKKTERDRALAKFWVEQGGNDELLSNDVFKDLLRALAPDYDMPSASHLAALVDEDQLN